MQQCVSFPTHALNILDLIIVPKEPAGVFISYALDVGPKANSDQTTILFKIKCKSFIVSNKLYPQLPVAYHFIFSKCNFEKAHFLLSYIDWDALLLPNLSTDILLQRFMDVWYKVIRVTVPTIHSCISRSSPLPSNIRRLILAKRIARRRSQISKNLIHLLNFRKLVSRLRSSLRAYRFACEAILLNSRDNNCFFGHI